MSAVDLLRVASAARRFLREVNRHDAQYDDPGYPRSVGYRVVRDAYQALLAALDGVVFAPDVLAHPGVVVQVRQIHHSALALDNMVNPTIGPLKIGPKELDPMTRAVEELEALAGDLRRGQPKTGRPQRRKPGEPAYLICTAIERLIEEGEWSATATRIRTLAGVARSTYNDVLSRDKKVQEAMAEYVAKSRGRGPARRRDI
jgi:hypothetical protein